MLRNITPHPAFRTGRGDNLGVGSRSVARRDRRRMQWGFGGAMEFVVEGRTGRGGVGEWGKHEYIYHLRNQHLPLPSTETQS